MIVVWFLLLIGPLILVHELGHFLFAKLFGVKVLRFSLGFGPAIKGMSWQRGETEYRISWFPVGGYVKMLGEDPDAEVAPEDQGRALHQKSLWQKYLIIVAGPGFNLLFPILIYFFYFLFQTTTAAPIVGTVVPGEPAAKAGLQAGDRFVEIDGSKVHYWQDMVDIVSKSPGKTLHLVVDRHGERVPIVAQPRLDLQPTKLGVVKKVGILGVLQAMTTSQVGVVGRDSPAAKAGLRPGDWIVALDGRPTLYWHQLRTALSKLDPSRDDVVLSVLRPTQPKGLTGLALFRPIALHLHPEVVQRQGRRVVRTGILSAEMFVSSVLPDSPAFRAGIRPRDRIVEVGGKPVESWLAVVTALSRVQDKPIEIAWRSPDGRLHRAKIRQERRVVLDDFKQEDVEFVFGAFNDMSYRYPPRVKITNQPIYAGKMAVTLTGEIISEMAMAVVQLFRGKVKADTVGGPIMLAKVAQVAASKGWDVFLWVMALISINLGLLNLLPVPILDGGHVVIFTVEAVRRKPLSLQARATVSYIGLVLLLALMVFAFRNDIVRYILN